MSDVGLDYLTLGQPLSTLSGGECQRIKLASELHKQGSIYVLDEPTTGLHMSDISHLLEIMNRLVDAGNTVIVIEHNMSVIKNADWIIDMGPEGGTQGREGDVRGHAQATAHCKAFADQRVHTKMTWSRSLSGSTSFGRLQFSSAANKQKTDGRWGIFLRNSDGRKPLYPCGFSSLCLSERRFLMAFFWRLNGSG